MKEKQLQILFIVIILLSVLYILYRWYEEKYVIDQFTNSDSVYYQNKVDSNDLQLNRWFSPIYKNVSKIVQNQIDIWTGYWESTNEFMIVKKLNNKVFMVLSKKDINENTNLNTTTNTLYPNFTLVTLFTINESEPNKVNHEETIQNLYNQSILNNTNTYMNYNKTQTGESIILTLNGQNITFSTVQRPNTSYFKKYDEILTPYYKTVDSKMTQITDIHCRKGKVLCKINNDVYGCSTSKDSSEMCLGENNDKCVLGNSSGIYQQVGDLSQCDPPFNMLQNSIDYVMNNIQDETENKTQLITCNNINKLTQFPNYIIAYKKGDDVSILSFQTWGMNKDESKLIMLSKNKIESFLTNPDMNELQKNIPLLWKLSKAYSYNTCYFTIQSKETKTTVPYYMNYVNEGKAYVSLFKGGSNQYFSLENGIETQTNNSNIAVYEGLLKASNGLYVSPGMSDSVELTPQFVNNQSTIVSLVSTPNTNGKWYIIGFNDSGLNNVSQYL